MKPSEIFCSNAYVEYSNKKPYMALEPLKWDQLH